MQQTCVLTGKLFEIRDQDLQFYEKLASAFGGNGLSVLQTSLCPDARQQRRLSWRNERSLYHRKCDLTGKQTISMYSPEKPYTVYQAEEWWSDKWNPLEYGRDFDFNRPFFEQFAELMKVVPRMNLVGLNNENCEFTNHTENSKNCYICADVAAEDTYYSKWMIHCRDCCDCYQLEKSELNYESQYSVNLYGSVYAFLCHGSSDLLFCYDCVGCHNCILSSHLRNQQYCIFNEQLTEEEYKKRKAELRIGSAQVLSTCKKRYDQMLKETFHRAQIVLSSEDCTGDFIDNCKNVHYSFGVIDSQDARYCYDSGYLKDCMDVYESAFDCELQYNCHGCNRSKRIIGCSTCADLNDSMYCNHCYSSNNLFGCIGIRRGEYCILNKQYSKEEYKQLLPRIVEHMKEKGEWGEFFSIEISPFCYNETVAQEYYPLTKEQVEGHGWSWHEDDERQKYMGPQIKIADHIDNVQEDICTKILTCKTSGKPYKIVPQELRFYKKMGVPVPRKSPDQRHHERMAYTNPRKIWDNTCTKCNKAIQTTYAPDRPEKVYCEECYLKEVY